METLHCPAQKLHCGGCPQLSLPYPAQLEGKQKLVRSLLAPFGPVEPILGAEQPLHYRNKAIATFCGSGARLSCGIYEAHTHRVIPAEHCLLQDERINEVLKAVLAAARACRYDAFDEDEGTGLLRHVVVRRGVRTGQISVAVVTPSAFLPGSKKFVALLRAACPDVVTVVQNINPRRTSAVLGSTEKVLFGSGCLEDELCGQRFLISTRAFYQVNPVQTERLYRTALDFAALTGRETVLDAYCGIGTIALAAAPQAKAVLGVELNSDAVANARRNAALNHAKNASFRVGDAGAVMAQAAALGQRADVVFLDPPREGASEQFLRALLQSRPGRIVYISCGPQSLARDLALLTAGGYRLQRAQPVDMFPHTDHVETVVLMSRVKD